MKTIIEFTWQFLKITPMNLKFVRSEFSLHLPSFELNAIFQKLLQNEFWDYLSDFATNCKVYFQTLHCAEYDTLKKTSFIR